MASVMVATIYRERGLGLNWIQCRFFARLQTIELQAPHRLHPIRELHPSLWLVGTRPSAVLGAASRPTPFRQCSSRSEVSLQLRRLTLQSASFQPGHHQVCQCSVSAGATFKKRDTNTWWPMKENYKALPLARNEIRSLVAPVST